MTTTTERPTFGPGISNADYHANPALGSTSLKTLATKTPAHYQHSLTYKKTSDAFDLGTAVHSLILEGDESGVEVWDFPAWTTKIAKESREESRAAGKIPMLTKDWQQVLAMRDAVMAHPVVRELFTGHKAEQSVFWEEDGLALKCRPDAWKPGHLVDLKTTVNADPREFGKTAYNFGYHQSAAHYIDGVQMVTGERLPFLFVLVEKTAPYLVSVVQLDDEAVEAGRALNERAKRIYNECTDSGNWPGYPDAEPISLPMWANYEMDDLLGINQEMEF